MHRCKTALAALALLALAACAESQPRVANEDPNDYVTTGSHIPKRNRSAADGVQVVKPTAGDMATIGSSGAAPASGGR